MKVGTIQMAQFDEEHSITQLLSQWHNGDRGAFDKLQALVHNTLRGIAHNKLKESQWSPGYKTTELVQEAYVALLGKQKKVNWVSRKHFFRLAGIVMRRILVNEARRTNSIKRGKEMTQTEFNEDLIPMSFDPDTVLLINEALEQLEKSDSDLVALIELRFFLGYSIRNTAEILGIPIIRANRMWQIAKSWLFDFLQNKK